MGREKKKSLFEKAIDALTNRDEKPAESPRGKAGAQARANIAVERPADEKAARQNIASEKAAADKMAENSLPEPRAASIRMGTSREAVTPEIAVPRKGIVAVRSLRIRADHSTASEVVGGLVRGDQVTVLDAWSDGRNTWAKLDKGWAAMLYDGETYIKIE